MTNTNRRRHTRFPLRLDCSVAQRGGARSLVTSDLSRAGFFIPGADCAPGEATAVSLKLPGTGSRVSSVCKAVRKVPATGPDAGGAAFVFGAMRPRDSRRLAAFFAAMPAESYKDRAPRETVRLAEEKLRRAGLTPKVKGSWAVGKGFYSVRLEDSTLAIGVNGKGLTRDYALASAYGEFLERLQNGALLPDRYGLMPLPAGSTPAFRTRRLAELMREHGEMMRILVKFPLPRSIAGRIMAERTPVVPFYSVTEGLVRELPLRYIARATASNGMCAGNSPEEALAQGLAEIAERYAMREIMLGRHTDVPTIPLSAVTSPRLRARISKLRSLGHKVTVKDCSLGGRFPVVGTILSSPASQTYISHFGSAPTFDTALERCLTESFQGSSKAPLPIDFSLPAAPEDRHAQFYAACRTGQGRMPPAMFLSGGEPAHGKAFLKVFHSNRNALKHMLDCFRRQGARIYVRDRSHLGFPAYRLYVPGYSELEQWNRDIPVNLPEISAGLRRTFLALRKISRRDAAAAARKLEELFSYPSFAFESSRFLARLFGGIVRVDLRPGSDLFSELCYSRDKLLCVLCHRAGEHARAEEFLRRHLERFPEEHTEYMNCCLAFLTLKARKESGAAVERGLRAFFGARLACEVLRDLSEPERAFDYYRLPACGDCSGCEVRGDCRYPLWKKITVKLRAASRDSDISQESLRQVFSGL